MIQFNPHLQCFSQLSFSCTTLSKKQHTNYYLGTKIIGCCLILFDFWDKKWELLWHAYHPKKKEQLTKELREVRARVRGQLFYTMNLEPQSYSLDTIGEISSR